jgi:hypothetical protein
MGCLKGACGMSTRFYAVLFKLGLLVSVIYADQKIENFSDVELSRPRNDHSILRGDLSYGRSMSITINHSGSYRLIDAMQAPGAAIVIQANNVVIDFDGHTVNGSIQISNNVDTLVLKNGILNGSISATNISNFTVQEMNIRSAQTGIFIAGTATKLLVQNSIIADYASCGLYVSKISSGRVENSSFVDSNFSGTGLAVGAGKERAYG